MLIQQLQSPTPPGTSIRIIKQGRQQGGSKAHSVFSDAWRAWIPATNPCTPPNTEDSSSNVNVSETNSNKVLLSLQKKKRKKLLVDRTLEQR